MHTLNIQINRKYGKYYAGEIIPVPCDENNIPLDQFWRRRLKDAQIDGVCEALPRELASFPSKKTKTRTGKGIKKSKRNIGGFK
jgi:hypothetical protein